MESEEKRFLESVREDISDIADSGGQEKAVYFVIGLSIATLLASLFVFGLKSSKISQISSLDIQIEEQVTAPLKTLAKEEKQVTAIGNQLDVLSTALSSRIKYGQIFKELALNTYKKIKWVSVDYSEERVVINGAADDFISASKAVTAFENFDAVKKVDLTSANIDESSGSIQFALELEIDETGYKFIAQTEKNAGR